MSCRVAQQQPVSTLAPTATLRNSGVIQAPNSKATASLIWKASTFLGRLRQPPARDRPIEAATLGADKKCHETAHRRTTWQCWGSHKTDVRFPPAHIESATKHNLVFRVGDICALPLAIG